MSDKVEVIPIQSGDVGLPELIDQRGLVEELGVTPHAAERIMRHVPKVQIDGLRKTYVRREDVRTLIDRATRDITVRAAA